MYADARLETGSDQLVLVRLDGGDDVAHRADAGAFDLLGQDAAGGAQLLAPVEVFVLEAGQLAPDESEPSSDGDALGVLDAGSVEAAGQWRQSSTSGSPRSSVTCRRPMWNPPCAVASGLPSAFMSRRPKNRAVVGAVTSAAVSYHRGPSSGPASLPPCTGELQRRRAPIVHRIDDQRLSATMSCRTCRTSCTREAPVGVLVGATA